MHRLWCGDKCCDCEKPCSLDESLPCNPDCPELGLNGERDSEACKTCDANIMNKVCKIINGKFAWLLEVDGQRVPFQGGCYADYFEKHYSELGYKVERITEED